MRGRQRCQPILCERFTARLPHHIGSVSHCNSPLTPLFINKPFRQAAALVPGTAIETLASCIAPTTSSLDKATTMLQSVLPAGHAHDATVSPETCRGQCLAGPPTHRNLSKEERLQPSLTRCAGNIRLSYQALTGKEYPLTCKLREQAAHLLLFNVQSTVLAARRLCVAQRAPWATGYCLRLQAPPQVADEVPRAAQYAKDSCRQARLHSGQDGRHGRLRCAIEVPGGVYFSE